MQDYADLRIGSSASQFRHGLARHGDAAIRHADDVACDGTENQACQPVLVTCSGHDVVAAIRRGIFHNGRCRITGLDHRGPRIGKTGARGYRCGIFEDLFDLLVAQLGEKRTTATVHDIHDKKKEIRIELCGHFGRLMHRPLCMS